MLFHHNSRASLLAGLAFATLHVVFFAYELSTGRFERRSRSQVLNVNISGFVNDNEVRWNKLFDFVPLGMKSCKELFPGEHKRLSSFTAELFDNKSRYTNKKRRLKIWRYPEQVMVLERLGSQAHVNAVCVFGYDAELATYVWLKASPRLKIYGFGFADDGNAKLLNKSLQRRYRSRIVATRDDWARALPKVRQQNPNLVCDVIFIDVARRTYDVVSSALRNLLSMTDGRSVVVFSGYPPKRPETGIGAIWERAKRLGEITEIFHCDYLPEHYHGFSVGRVEPRLNQLISKSLTTQTV